MTCKLKRRIDTIPKRKGERTWACEECGALMFGPVKPQCRRAMQAQVEARRASAQAEAHILGLDEKVKPT